MRVICFVHNPKGLSKLKTCLKLYCVKPEIRCILERLVVNAHKVQTSQWLKSLNLVVLPELVKQLLQLILDQ